MSIKLLLSNHYKFLTPNGTIPANAKVPTSKGYIIDSTDATAMISGNFFNTSTVLYIEPVCKGERHD